ncbi:hypothetical protein [Natrinema salaciae]|uniref:DUF7974 domain-containing protein n=1 Tax=Natrinema salaciae TaxID=1186196 RepID=A0A1H9R4N9_9EURY|nr:hypothetical protein [Natrinema salaciae]SER67668.1 hypothetical protein SAMN04489841_4276 [Natrinema salaciae]
MKRIDESRTLERDDEPFAPGGDGSRTIDWAAFSHAFTPTALRYRAIDVSVSTDARRYEPGEPVDITVEFRNRLPFPIRIRTESPNRWTWAVDGRREASTVPRTVPDRPAAFSFARGERKTFRRQWSQRIQIADDEWVPVGPGTYAIEVRVSRSDAAARGLTDRTDVEIAADGSRTADC